MVAKKYQSKTGGLNEAGRNTSNVQQVQTWKDPLRVKSNEAQKQLNGEKVFVQECQAWKGLWKTVRVDQQGKHLHLENGNVNE